VAGDRGRAAWGALSSVAGTSARSFARALLAGPKIARSARCLSAALRARPTTGTCPPQVDVVYDDAVVRIGRVEYPCSKRCILKRSRIR
jgi:hypothetical protein